MRRPRVQGASGRNGILLGRVSIDRESVVTVYYRHAFSQYNRLKVKTCCGILRLINEGRLLVGTKCEMYRICGAPAFNV
jgi:hypothetical protein